MSSACTSKSFWIEKKVVCISWRKEIKKWIVDVECPSQDLNQDVSEPILAAQV
jgi:hypothetical protein